MPDDIYWEDGFAWAEQQSALLQRLANGERVNAEIDWEHVVEEVRDVGLSELRAVESLLTRAIENLFKLHGWAAAQSRNHWSVEALTFLSDAQKACTRSMRKRVNLDDCYRRAWRPVARLVIDGQAAAKPPALCPFTLAELLPQGDEEPDIDALVAKLHT